MAEVTHKSHTKEYLFIFGLMTLLTVLELFVPGMENVSKLVKGTALTVLAIGKAFLVAYFFMHLKEEKTWMKLVAAVPISAALYAAVLILESIAR
jgi:cytochrome c oxidase subunit 4